MEICDGCFMFLLRFEGRIHLAGIERRYGSALITGGYVAISMSEKDEDGLVCFVQRSSLADGMFSFLLW